MSMYILFACERGLTAKLLFHHPTTQSREGLPDPKPRNIYKGTRHATIRLLILRSSSSVHLCIRIQGIPSIHPRTIDLEATYLENKGWILPLGMYGRRATQMDQSCQIFSDLESDC
jgi:hypothetical protein